MADRDVKYVAESPFRKFRFEDQVNRLTSMSYLVMDLHCYAMRQWVQKKPNAKIPINVEAAVSSW